VAALVGCVVSITSPLPMLKKTSLQFLARGCSWLKRARCVQVEFMLNFWVQ
jgi:hypothetical protein